MSAATVLTLANGKGVDLLDPKASDIDWEALAEHLAKEKRFNGATPDEEYSVAEHLARGADAILTATGDAVLAAYFSLHDCHEAMLKDITTPLKRAIAEMASMQFGVLAPQIIETFSLLEYRHDAAIHNAAGLKWPASIEIAAKVKHYDLVMFVTEWRDLMHGVPHPDWKPYRGIKPLRDAISPWRWQTAASALMRRWRRLLPALGVDALAHSIVAQRTRRGERIDP